jgi:hypothetical protein
VRKQASEPKGAILVREKLTFKSIRSAKTPIETRSLRDHLGSYEEWRTASDYGTLWTRLV